MDFIPSAVEFEDQDMIDDHTRRTKTEEKFKFESYNATHTYSSKEKRLLQCKGCDFISFQSLDSHECVKRPPISCPGCINKFKCIESFTSHLVYDHKVRTNEIESFTNRNKRVHIVDYQLLKPDVSEANQPKSKIFIKDVTLLRKPELPHNYTSIPNIFDSLDLTTNEEDIFDEQFFGSDDPIFDDDFDFEECRMSNVETTPEPTPEIEIVPPIVTEMPAKIFLRKNLCHEILDENVEDTTESTSAESLTSKIYVRSHESLTSSHHDAYQPCITTPDCVDVSSQVLAEPQTSKIFIRNLETLTNPAQESSPNQYFPNTSPDNSSASDSFQNLPVTLPSIYLRYDSLVSSIDTDQNTLPNESAQKILQNSRCKISIKNMNTLIEPLLMLPPLINQSSMIFGQAQNLVIHMRPQQDDSLIEYPDNSMTPDTLPETSIVSNYEENDDVIILGDGEYRDTFIESELQDETDEIIDTSPADEIVPVLEKLDQNNSMFINSPENDDEDLKVVSSNINPVLKPAEPMVRIPIHFSEPTKESPTRRKVKIVKIIRIKQKRENVKNGRSLQSSNIQVVFKCSHRDCNLNFSKEHLMIYHKKCHTTEGTIKCPECKIGGLFKNFQSLHTHLWRKHSIDMDLYSCKLCDFKTPVLSRLKSFHEKIHDKEMKYACVFPKCTKRFKNSKQLRNHASKHVLKESDSTKNIRCLVKDCRKGFSSESGLYIHMKEHNFEDKKFHCEECNYNTNDHNSFRRHKSQHSLVMSYKCSACDYSTIQSTPYRKHLEKQHPELAKSLLHKCSDCNFTTISVSKFEAHRSKHGSPPNQRKP